MNEDLFMRSIKYVLMEIHLQLVVFTVEHEENIKKFDLWYSFSVFKKCPFLAKLIKSQPKRIQNKKK